MGTHQRAREERTAAAKARDVEQHLRMAGQMLTGRSSFLGQGAGSGKASSTAPRAAAAKTSLLRRRGTARCEQGRSIGAARESAAVPQGAA